jgi:hypothetical protein
LELIFKLIFTQFNTKRGIQNFEKISKNFLLAAKLFKSAVFNPEREGYVAKMFFDGKFYSFCVFNLTAERFTDWGKLNFPMVVLF